MIDFRSRSARSPAIASPESRIHAAVRGSVAAAHLDADRNDPDGEFVSSRLGERDAIPYTGRDRPFTAARPQFRQPPLQRSVAGDNRDLCRLLGAMAPANLPGFGIPCDQGHTSPPGFFCVLGHVAGVFKELRAASTRCDARTSAGVGHECLRMLGIQAPSSGQVDLGYP